jgi:hypothetical protein
LSSLLSRLADRFIWCFLSLVFLFQGVRGDGGSWRHERPALRRMIDELSWAVPSAFLISCVSLCSAAVSVLAIPRDQGLICLEGILAFSGIWRSWDTEIPHFLLGWESRARLFLPTPSQKIDKKKTTIPAAVRLGELGLCPSFSPSQQGRNLFSRHLLFRCYLGHKGARTLFLQN